MLAFSNCLAGQSNKKKKQTKIYNDTLTNEIPKDRNPLVRTKQKYFINHAKPVWLNSCDWQKHFYIKCLFVPAHIKAVRA